MLLPSTSIDCLDAILDAIDAQFLVAHADDGPMLQVGCVRDCIVPFHITLVSDPEVAEEWNGPMC